MTKIPKDIFIPLNTKRDKPNNSSTNIAGLPNKSVSVIEFLEDKLTVSNGLTKEGLNFKIGGELSENTEVRIADGVDFSFVRPDGTGLFAVEDSGNPVLALGNFAANNFLIVNTNGIAIKSEEIIYNSDNLFFQDSLGNDILFVGKIGGVLNIRVPAIPIYVSEAAAAGDAALPPQSLFRVTNGNGTSSINIKD